MKGALTLWGFEVTSKDSDTITTAHGALTQDGVEVLFIGNANDVNEVAEGYRVGIANLHPGAKVTVRPTHREQVGPRAVRQMARVGKERQEWKAIARYLAWRMAEAAARATLELNPSIPALALQILDEARIGAMEEMEKAAAKRPGVLVDSQGRPARG